jgi:hypothetical protein
MRTLPLRGVSVLATLLLFLASPAGRLRADLDDEIGEATDLGIDFLLKAIEAKQSEGEDDGARKRGGKIALETYALLVAGVSVEHPTIKKNFDTLAGMNLDHTYSVACYTFALDAAISQLQNDAGLAAPSQKFKDDSSLGGAYRPRLEAAVNALVHLKRAKSGDWNYTKDGSRFDNSNTQFAVLGLGVGAKRKVPIPREVWEQVAQHFIQGQKKDGPEVAERPEFYPEEEKGEGKRDRINLVDKKTGEKVEKGKKAEKKQKEKKEGSPTVVKPVEPKPQAGPEAVQYFARGWDYDGKGGETWNMSCGGTSSMILAEENLRGQVPADFHNQMKKSVRDGYGWLMSHWNPAQGGDWEYYGIYSLEKVADLGEVKKFASHDWYREVAELILARQIKDGGWPGSSPMARRWNTSFALLVLNRATSLLTQGRSVKAGRLVLTGAIRHDKEISDDRNWVFIPKYEREFHIPSLLRQMKLRPTQNLMRIIAEALKCYPEEQNGFLVWNLAHSREEQKSKAAREFLDGQLQRITGIKYDGVAQYEKWYRRWVDVQKIGTEMQDPNGLLQVAYPNTSKSLPLRKKIIWALARCKNQTAAPLLIEDLSHAETDVRQAAYEALSLLRLSKEPIPAFDPKAAAEARDQQVALIRDWYQKRKV